MASANVPRFYESVIDDVIANVRGEFIDEGVDEQALTELKMVWKKKLQESKAIEKEPDPVISKTVTQALQPVQQVATSIGATSITHQLTMPSANVVPQTLLQYTTTQGSSDVQKTMALNLPQKITLTVPAQLAQSGLQTLVGAAPGTTAVQLPAEIASLFQSNVIASAHSNNLAHGGQQIAGVHYQTLTSEQLKNAQQFTVAIPVTTPQSQANVIGQLDGPNDTSDEDDEDDFQDNDDNDDDNEDDQNEDDIRDEDEEPLNSDDDVSEEETSNLSDIENVVVCQYDKITRSKNRWKFHLKDGIMNLKGKDFVFHKALGDSEW